MMTINDTGMITVEISAYTIVPSNFYQCLLKTSAFVAHLISIIHMIVYIMLMMLCG